MKESDVWTWFVNGDLGELTGTESSDKKKWKAGGRSFNAWWCRYKFYSFKIFGITKLSNKEYEAGKLEGNLESKEKNFKRIIPRDQPDRKLVAFQFPVVSKSAPKYTCTANTQILNNTQLHLNIKCTGVYT